MRPMSLSLIGLSLFTTTSFAASLAVSSPDGKITFTLSDDNSQPTYQVSFNDKTIIQPSKLGFDFATAASMRDGLSITTHQRNSVDSSWQQPWGEARVIQDKHNELAVTFAKQTDKSPQYTVRVKVFDDGVGFRYEVAQNQALYITRELTEFAFAQSDKSTAWWIPARGWNRYEYVYNTTPLHDAPHVHTPFTLKNQDDWFINTIMIEGIDVPFKYKRKQPYKSLKGQRINITYYPHVENVAGFEIEVMNIVRIKVS